MGLFSKKPKASTPATPAAAPAPKAAPAEKPSKPAKGKKHSVDPTDFLALRSEMLDLKARLEASEQAKAMVETRLAALDATTTAIATERPPGDDLRTRVAELQAQLGEVAEAAATANVNAENAAAKATAAATVAAEANGSPAATKGPDQELVARIDALAAQVNAVSTPSQGLADRLDALAAKVETVATTDPALAERVDALSEKIANAPAADPGLLARLDQLSARLDGTPDNSRVIEIEARIGELAAKSAEQPAPAADADTLARIDQLAERVAAVDSFGSQLAQLNARVSAQAEFGAQLSSLRDRISELQNDTEDRRAAALAATGDADLRDRVNTISDRIASQEGLAAQIAQLAERVAANDASTRVATEQVSAVEQRLNAVSTELANQVSELGRDLDGLAAHTDDTSRSAVSDELFDGLKTSQVKLAAEQARYEIAFRQDLAALAEQVRRSTKG